VESVSVLNLYQRQMCHGNLHRFLLRMSFPGVSECVVLCAEVLPGAGHGALVSCVRMCGVVC